MPVGLLLIGDGTRRQKLELIAHSYRNVAVLPPIVERDQLAQLLASADGLAHGCESETFCLVAAEARASGIPLIVPAGGAAADQVVAGAGITYRAGREASLEDAIGQFIARGPELQRAVAVRASRPRTMEAHFADLFELYGSLAPRHAPVVPVREVVGEVALARA